MTIVAVDSDDGSYADALADSLFTGHTLIRERRRPDRLLWAGSWSAQIDHHRRVHGVDRDPLLPLIDVAVAEPTAPPNWCAHEGAFGRVLDETPSDPFATCRDVFRDNWRFVTATTERPVDFVTDAPPPDEWLQRLMAAPGQPTPDPTRHVLLARLWRLDGDEWRGWARVNLCQN